MQTDMKDRAAQPDSADEELIDTLIAISVVAKRLARKLTNQRTKEGDRQDEQNE